MSHRAVLTGAGLLIVSASCEAPDGSSLFRSHAVDVPALASAGAGGAASGQGTAAAAGAPSNPVFSGDAGSELSEGQSGEIGLVPIAGSGGQAVSAASGTADAGASAVSDAGAADAGEPVDAPPPPACIPDVERCDGLDNDCDGDVDEGTACAPDCAGFALADRGYMFCSSSVERDVAADRCELEGMRLAWIETEKENEFLVESIAAADVPPADDDELLTYMGASDSGNEGNWIWRGRGAIANGFQFWQGAALGSAVGGAFESWAPGEPNNSQNDENCAAISVFGSNNRDPGEWDDRDCDSELPFVCEVP